jgi:hypothetical protein
VVHCRAEAAYSAGGRHQNQGEVNQDYSAWQLLYNDAVVELAPIELLAKIESAQKAIGDRLNDALHGRNPIDAIERQAIEDARHTLYFLRKHPTT